MPRFHLALAALLLSACSTAAERSPGAHGTGPVSSGPASASGGETGLETDAPSEDAGGPRFDVGAPGESGGGGKCSGIDLLVVIDNTQTMASAQDKLIGGVQTFMEAMLSADPLLAATMHVGVTKTDSYFPGEDPGPAPDPCAMQLGGLLGRATPVGGPTGFGRDCELRSDRDARYAIAGSDLGAFVGRFSCVARVGTYGDERERAAEAALTALGAERQLCNSGFLRSDSLLVVLLVSDEDDVGSAPHSDPGEDVRAWVRDLSATRPRGADDVVLLVLSGGWPPFPECAAPEGATRGLASGSPKLSGWVDSMPFSLQGNICAEDYVGFLLDASELVLATCRQQEGP